MRVGQPEWRRPPPSSPAPGPGAVRGVCGGGRAHEFPAGCRGGGLPEQAQTVVHHALDLLWLFMDRGQDVEVRGSVGEGRWTGLA